MSSSPYAFGPLPAAVGVCVALGLLVPANLFDGIGVGCGSGCISGIGVGCGSGCTGIGVGALTGRLVGAVDGCGNGFLVGSGVGRGSGRADCSTVGRGTGGTVGRGTGLRVCTARVGCHVGLAVAPALGCALGATLGATLCDGFCVDVGSRVRRFGSVGGSDLTFGASVGAADGPPLGGTLSSRVGRWLDDGAREPANPWATDGAGRVGRMLSVGRHVAVGLRERSTVSVGGTVSLDGVGAALGAALGSQCGALVGGIETLGCAVNLTVGVKETLGRAVVFPASVGGDDGCGSGMSAIAWVGALVGAYVCMSLEVSVAPIACSAPSRTPVGAYDVVHEPLGAYVSGSLVASAAPVSCSTTSAPSATGEAEMAELGA